jgi:hypothetical protein
LAKTKLLVHGHEPCAEGFQVPNTKQVILDCCCEDACFVILPIHGELTQQDVVARITKLYPRCNGN